MTRADSRIADGLRRINKPQRSVMWRLKKHIMHCAGLHPNRVCENMLETGFISAGIPKGNDCPSRCAAFGHQKIRPNLYRPITEKPCVIPCLAFSKGSCWLITKWLCWPLSMRQLRGVWQRSIITRLGCQTFCGDCRTGTANAAGIPGNSGFKLPRCSSW